MYRIYCIRCTYVGMYALIPAHLCMGHVYRYIYIYLRRNTDIWVICIPVCEKSLYYMNSLCIYVYIYMYNSCKYIYISIHIPIYTHLGNDMYQSIHINVVKSYRDYISIWFIFTLYICVQYICIHLYNSIHIYIYTHIHTCI